MRGTVLATAVLIGALAVADASAKTNLRFSPTSARMGDRVALGIRSHEPSGRHATGYVVYLVHSSYVNQALYPPVGGGHRRTPVRHPLVVRVGAIRRDQTQLTFVVPGGIRAGRYAAMLWCRCGQALDASVPTSIPENGSFPVRYRALLTVRR